MSHGVNQCRIWPHIFLVDFCGSDIYLKKIFFWVVSSCNHDVVWVQNIMLTNSFTTLTSIFPFSLLNGRRIYPITFVVESNMENVKDFWNSLIANFGNVNITNTVNGLFLSDIFPVVIPVSPTGELLYFVSWNYAIIFVCFEQLRCSLSLATWPW